MDLSRGCILLARSIDESDIFQNEKWLKVWIWCLIKANHKGKSVPVKTGKYETVVKLNRGQFIFGRHKSAKILNMKSSTVRNIMEKLEKLENLDIKPDTHYSIVTIRDYDLYQNIESYKGQAKGQAEDNQRTTKGQPKDTNKNDKHYKNEKKKNIEKPDSVTEQTWNDFLTHRKTKKANVTLTVLKNFEREAKKAGWSLENALIETVSRGWSGFKSDWVIKDNKPTGDGSELAAKRKRQTEELFNGNS